MQDLISIIVPVYNVEDYLDKCITSIVSQTYTNLEIIVINDGSTDNSGVLCDQRSQKDSRIKVIHKNNGGLSDARNVGLDNITGSYIAFVDSDDIIHPQYIQLLYTNLIHSHADLSTCQFFTFTDDDLPKKNTVFNKEKLYTQADYLNSNQTESSCTKLYKKEIFSDLRFKVGVAREDSYLFPDLIDRCQTIISTSAKLYGYRQRFGSITHYLTKDKLQQWLDCFIYRTQFYQKNHNTRQSKIAQMRQQIIKNDFYRFFGDDNFWIANKRLYNIIFSKYTTLFRKAYAIKQLYFPFITLNKQKVEIIKD